MGFDWTAIIERGRADLARLLVMLSGFAALAAAQGPAFLSRAEYHAALRLLRPAESALRRLIVIAARGLSVLPASRRAAMTGGFAAVPDGRGRAFPLFDPRRIIRVDGARAVHGRGPQIRSFDMPETEGAARLYVGARAAAPLLRRLERLERALADLPAQARRLARWRARHPGAVKQPMRPGRPPGFRARGAADFAQIVLTDLQQLSLWATTPENP